jgi:hypothetical protein
MYIYTRILNLSYNSDVENPSLPGSWDTRLADRDVNDTNIICLYLNLIHLWGLRPDPYSSTSIQYPICIRSISVSVYLKQVPI